MFTDTLSRVRVTAVAGMFYPADAAQLEPDIYQYLSHVSSVDTDSDAPKALIVPHAGFIYSAPIAASAYQQLTPGAHHIKQVILLGPSHQLAFCGVATPDADYFATPLGHIKINQALCQQAQTLHFVQANRLAHLQEHSLEVQLPFLQTILTDFEITPLVVGECGADDVALLLKLLWGNDDTLIIISTDLSHYHNYETARQIDNQTSQAIIQLQPEKIHAQNACGKAPLNGLLTLAKEKRLKIDCLDLRNSADTAGSKDRVVGYGAYAVY